MLFFFPCIPFYFKIIVLNFFLYLIFIYFHHIILYYLNLSNHFFLFSFFIFFLCYFFIKYIFQYIFFLISKNKKSFNINKDLEKPQYKLPKYLTTLIPTLTIAFLTIHQHRYFYCRLRAFFLSQGTVSVEYRPSE